MFTKRAVGLLVSAFLLFLIAGVTNVGWVRIFDAVLWGMLLLSLLLQWLSITKVDASRRLTAVHRNGSWDGPMEDDVVEVDVTLRNRWFWPRFFISLSYDAPMESLEDRIQRFFIANLKGHDDVSVVSRVRCYRRGLHRFGPVAIESQVPFGLFTKRKRKEAPLSLLVYPRAYPIRNLALLEGPRGTSNQPRRARSGQEVVGSRQYHQGDPLRYIHWRNTARLGKLAVKEIEDAAEKSLTVVFDTRHSYGTGREATLEYAIKLAATIGLHAIRSGESISLQAGNVRGEFMDPEPYLRELALLEVGESPPLTELLRQTPTSSTAVTIVSASDDEGLRALSDHPRQSAGVAAIVLDGFQDPDEPTVALNLLRQQGVPAIACMRGNIEAAVADLEQLNVAARRDTAVSQPVA